MFSCSKESVSDLSILDREGVMDDASTTLILDGKTDKYSNCGQVTLDEIACSIKWVNPHAGIFRVESFEGIN